MKEQDKLNIELGRAEHARQILKNPLVVQALHDMREGVFHNIRTSHFKDTAEREDLYKMICAIDSFERIFKRHIESGTVAQSRLEELKRIAKNVTNWR